MNLDRKPGLKEWAKIRARQKAISMRNFKFWYMTNSGLIVVTDVMTEAEALEWLNHNQQNITALQFNEIMTSREAYDLIKHGNNHDDGLMG